MRVHIKHPGCICTYTWETHGLGVPASTCPTSILTISSSAFDGRRKPVTKSVTNPLSKPHPMQQIHACPAAPYWCQEALPDLVGRRDGRVEKAAGPVHVSAHRLPRPFFSAGASLHCHEACEDGKQNGTVL